MIKRALFPLILFLLVSGEARGMSAFETARTLPDGAYRIHFGFLATQSVSTAGSSWGKTGEIGGRLGLSRIFDLGFSFAVPEFTLDAPQAGLDFRFQLISVQGFAMNLALGLSYTHASVLTVSLDLLSIVPEFNVGYDFNQYVAIYVAGRDQTPIIAKSSAGNVTTSSVFTTTLGFRFGDTWGLRAEGGLAFSLASGGGSGAVIGGTLFVGQGNRLQSSTETNRRAESWKDRQSERAPRERTAGRTKAARNPSKTLKVKAEKSIALITQPENGSWRIGDGICFFRNGESLACGTVTKSDTTGAVVQYTGKADIVPGMDAFPTGTDPSARLQGRPAPQEQVDDLGDPTLEDLP